MEQLIDYIVHLTNEYILMIILVMKVRCRIVETPWAGRVTRAGRHGRGNQRSSFSSIIFSESVSLASLLYGHGVIFTFAPTRDTHHL